MKAELNVQETTPMSQEDVTKIAEENVDENGLILGKFKTQEDLIKSYTELEKLNLTKILESSIAVSGLSSPVVSILKSPAEPDMRSSAGRPVSP